MEVVVSEGRAASGVVSGGLKSRCSVPLLNKSLTLSRARARVLHPEMIPAVLHSQTFLLRRWCLHCITLATRATGKRPGSLCQRCRAPLAPEAPRLLQRQPSARSCSGVVRAQRVRAARP